MPYLDSVRKQIQELEEKISNHDGNMKYMKQELERLKKSAFEEEMRLESDTRQLLNG